MTIDTNTLRRTGPSTGNSVTTAFPFDWKVFTAAEVVVVELNIATSVETTKVSVTHYTVALNADQDTDPGGTVNAVVAPTAAVRWTLISNVQAIQPADLLMGGGFQPRVIENELDRAIILIQQLYELQSRSLLLPLSFNITALLPQPTAFYRLGWSDDGTRLVNYAPGVGSVSVVNAYQRNQYSVPVDLTPGASVAVDASLSNNFHLTPEQNFTLQNPTNMANGMTLNFAFTNNATPRTITFGSKYVVVGNSALSTTANKGDFMSCYYHGPSDKLRCVLNGEF